MIMETSPFNPRLILSLGSTSSSYCIVGVSLSIYRAIVIHSHATDDFFKVPLFLYILSSPFMSKFNLNLIEFKDVLRSKERYKLRFLLIILKVISTGTLLLPVSTFNV